MKHMRKPSTVWIIFLILFISMSLMLIAGESVIHIARQELETRALETTKAEIGHISDALYAQLTSIQMENTEILNNESVLALAMRSSILDKFEMVSYKSAIMKLMRTELSRTNIATKAQLYIPTVRTIITPQKAVEVSDEELQELLSIVTAFPNGLYYTEGEIGFWSASPLIYNAAAARDSRIMMTGIPRSFLREMLGSYTQPIGCQLLLTFGNHILANSHDIEWDESVYGEFPKDVKTVESGGSSYYVIRAKHAFSDLSIVAVLPVNNVMRNMHRLQRMMKILELISLLILALAAVAYYRIVCAPLKRSADRPGIQIPPAGGQRGKESAAISDLPALSLQHLFPIAQSDPAGGKRPGQPHGRSDGELPALYRPPGRPLRHAGGGAGARPELR